MKILKTLINLALANFGMAFLAVFSAPAFGREELVEPVFFPWGVSSVGILGIAVLIHHAFDADSVINAVVSFNFSFFGFGTSNRRVMPVAKHDQPILYWLFWTLCILISIAFVALGIWFYFYTRSHSTG